MDPTNGVYYDAIRFPLSNGGTYEDMAFWTNGSSFTEKMRITGGGNVGIGSTAPGMQLDVNGTVRATAFIGNGAGLTNLVAEGAAGTNTQVQYNSSGNMAGSSNFTFNGTNVGIGTVQVASNSYLLGNVGIGTTTPQGALVVTNGNVGIGTWTAAGGNLIVNGGGNVGIGSAWPGQLFDVNGNMRSVGTNEHYFGSDNANGILNSAATSGDMRILTNSLERMRIVNSGNIGIGSTAPGMQLDVNGTVRATAFIGNGAGLTNLLAEGAAGTNTQVQYSSSGTMAGNSNFTFNGTNVGIGTVQVANNSYLLGNVGIGTTTPQGALVVTNGNVGIGTWAPVKSLSVTGDTYHNGNIGVGTTFVGGTGEASFTVMNGNVGIGTWVSKNSLDVNGGMSLGSYAE